MKLASSLRGALLFIAPLLGGCGKDQGSAGAPSPSARAADLAPSAAPAATSATAVGGDSPASYAPCDAPPERMACVPGGPAVLGSSEGEMAELPRHTVEISTFYIDRYEVTNADYARCEAAGRCAAREHVMPDYAPFLEPDLPAVTVSWDRARSFCAFAGKRLPSEAEWEKVARGGPEGRLYPWGAEPPTCDRAQLKGCPPDTTRAVGSFAPGPYGVHDMAGNGYEWVQDWASDCYGGCLTPCGADCLGRDPLGPCAGAPRCEGKERRVLKGGSWYWPGADARGSARRAELPASGPHRLSFRCASTLPRLAITPPDAAPPARPPQRPAPAKPAPSLVDPAAPLDGELATFRDVPEDLDVLSLPACDRPGEARHDCRDPQSYLVSNEFEQHLFEPYLRGKGGGYVGVGADQSYSFIAAARSEWAWLLDYDPAVVRLHALIRAVVLEASTPRAFVDAFADDHLAATRAVLRRAFAGDPVESEATVALFDRAHSTLFMRYGIDLAPRPDARAFGWLRDPEAYRYVRLLLSQGRILARKCNLLTRGAMAGVAASARRLGVPVRVYYPSNADDLWELTRDYRANVVGLPFDDRSVVIRTIFQGPGDGGGRADWRYLVHGGLDEQRKLAREGYRRVSWFLEESVASESPLLNLLAVPPSP